ncbi:mechanosensitive ion channel family protein [Paenibacillus apiarius]|uniref:Mechanosensitive ion channel family protein n=1 Tax=Paenibacillus apiarius TaxID=46240 RepID=A0ABT4E1U1_9BACL|nr:mechanosensitive ion channel family protein [Paenibacillus apiarius]MCY9517555.1 mechanosensitive ion channel family protein [Paenibacillus apiarius]MCY9522166.1 mechanosensitive ion channel family protein [Paenibacillus apiarius]MCY9552200.1 mechanosensitive ion channel family protein [Paenibacillus apiarius]MCY9560079.1 mechanosensitive ion channel family protein [Paenibacillus apiarius]MCY9683697.1 mechanosensitive ion channel family protein [Paenibacillus apiarius]
MDQPFHSFFEQIDGTRLLIAIGILLLFLFFRKWVAGYLFRFIVRMADKTRSTNIASFMHSFEQPVRMLLILGGVNAAFHFYFPDQWPYWPLFKQLSRSSFIAIVGWGLYNFSGRSSNLFTGFTTRLGVEQSSMLIPFLSRILRIVIVAVAITMISSEWGYSINGLVAGLGLGSLAVAMAAKDTFSNFIAGVIIITEKPFARGDWIQTSTVEGVVEDISFRSSRIRTFADTLVIVPNATLADQAITNFSRMGKRRITFTLGVGVDTGRASLLRAVERIRDHITAHPEVAPGTIMIRFTEFHADQLGIMCYFFTQSTVWAEHLRVREEINFAIMDILEQEGVRLAMPAQRVFLEAKEQEFSKSSFSCDS